MYNIGYGIVYTVYSIHYTVIKYKYLYRNKIVLLFIPLWPTLHVNQLIIGRQKLLEFHTDFILH